MAQISESIPAKESKFTFTLLPEAVGEVSLS